MAYEMKQNSGSLFVNDKRDKDSQPNAKGSALIDGVAYWVSAWTNEAKDGQKYQSLKFERKDEPLRQAREGSRGSPPEPSLREELSDDIPFLTMGGVFDA